jgi:hypothetical protein
MSSKGYQGRGSTLAVETTLTSPVAWTNIAQLQKFAFGGIKVATDNITNLDSPDAFEEILATTINPGDVSFDGILDPANAEVGDLVTRLQARTLSNFKITLTDGSKFTFSGYFTELVPATVEYSKAIMYSGKITITGAVTGPSL